ncbi:MAG: ferrochelatase [Brevundimonas sp.]|uniref:ferrochelatase n=1 Tax=Brevundimonas sp. TaxID=1871086 RepID=UPI00391B449B
MTDTASPRRIAVVLMNLGGPDGQESVRPFLFNLFNDPAIIGLPGLVRTPLAKFISSKREEEAKANYAMMGGGSPLLPETEKQAAALRERLNKDWPGDDVRVFIAMRYWHPLTPETAKAVEAFAPDQVVLLPLYPQFSTTTTQSSLKAWREHYRGPGRISAVCCYPEATGWIEAQAALITAQLAKAGDKPVRVLFSAHGIPENLVHRKGDPYQEQVERTVFAVVERLGLQDWTICYQSRVGPLKWLGPSTPDAIEQAGRDGVGAVVVPIAFVSEHVETLVELDVEYGHLAQEKGVSPYLRVSAVGVAGDFIGALADAVGSAVDRTGIAPYGPGCQGDWKACPCRGMAA